MAYSDSHCHLDSYPPEQLAVVLEQMRTKHVDIVVSMASNLESSEKNVRLAQSYEGVRAGVGIHPWYAVLPTAEVRGRLNELARREHVVAIGEIGLDYARQPQTKEVQKELLKYELSLARETGLPVNIHCREAHQDVMAILRDEVSAGLRGIAHGFTGDLATLNDWLSLGFYISFGVRGFAANDIASLEAVVRKVPLDRLITETDSVAGEQLRRPADIISVVQKIAAIRGMAVEKIASATTANLRRILKL
jgi:TatD DNase family protein